VKPLTAWFANVLLENPWRFFKQSFWNENGKKLVSLPNVHFVYEFNQDRYTCAWMVLSPRHGMKSKTCNYDLMTSIYIGHVHNLSLYLLDKYNKWDVERFSRTPGIQFMSESGANKYIHLEPQYITGTSYHFSFQTSARLFYCFRHSIRKT